MSLKENIKENEGFKSYVYKDTLGFDTVGYGFKVSSLSKDELFLNGGKVEPMSKAVADQILEMSLLSSYLAFVKLFLGWKISQKMSKTW
ncbi:hypothetical protein [Campylobacter concisus]|uniref:hypothetical protein n=1 Tax=Campylobacter concisus TaxID=199 RepID=UPI0021560122|nr:hypothetical protein [Campylobacter concisus]